LRERSFNPRPFVILGARPHCNENLR
jgi:hypothetical protein